MNNETTGGAVPALRFAEFRDAGEWVVEPFEDVYSLKGTNSLSRENLNYEEGSVKNIHYGDIHTKFSAQFDIAKERVPFINPTVAVDKIKDENYCVEGDVVFADASEDLNDIGKSIEVVRLNREKVVSGLHTLLARQKAQKLVVGFGGHLFMSGIIRSQIQTEAQGTKVLGISAGRLSKIKLCYPADKTEQQKIAATLSSLDDLIGAESEKLQALKVHKRGLMQGLFPAEGETVPGLRFAEFEGEWVEKKLGEISTITSGGTPNRAKSEYWNGNVPWVTTSLVDFNTIVLANEHITDAGLQNSSAKLFPKDTILMAMYGQGKTRGKVAILGIEAATNQACAAILVKDDFDISFVFQSLAGRYQQIRELSNQGGQENLSGGLIEAIPIAYPELEEQQKIASVLSSLDALLTAQAQKIDALKAHKRGLMQALFPMPERAPEGRQLW